MLKQKHYKSNEDEQQTSSFIMDN